MLTAGCYSNFFLASPCGITYNPHETPGFHVSGVHVVSGQLSINEKSCGVQIMLDFTSL